MNKQDIDKLLEKKGNELSIKDLSQYNLIEIADALLKSTVVNSKALEQKTGEMDKDDVQKGKLVLGHLNALINAFGKKIVQVRMDMDVGKKVSVIKKLRKGGHFK